MINAKKAVIIIGSLLIIAWVIIAAIINLDAILSESFVSRGIYRYAAFIGPSFVLTTVVTLVATTFIKEITYKVALPLIVVPLVSYLSFISIAFLTILIHGL